MSAAQTADAAVNTPSTRRGTLSLLICGKLTIVPHCAGARVYLDCARTSGNHTTTAMGKKSGGQKKGEGKRWTRVLKPRRESAPVAATEPFRPVARSLRHRAPIANRGSGDDTPHGVGASQRIPPETRLIGVAVRGRTPDDSTFLRIIQSDRCASAAYNPRAYTVWT